MSKPGKNFRKPAGIDRMRHAANMITVLGRIALVAILANASSGCSNRGDENAQLSVARAVQYDWAGLVKLEPSAIAAANSAVFRERHRLVLHLRSGADKIYENSEGCYHHNVDVIGDCSEFILISYVKRRGMFLALKQYYEAAEYLLVDDTTGGETAIAGLPMFSPGGDRILVLRNSAFDNIWGFEIWRRTEDTFDLDWSGDPVERGKDTWIEYRLGEWRSDTELEVSATLTSYERPPSIRKIHVILVDGEWEVVVSDAP